MSEWQRWAAYPLLAAYLTGLAMLVHQRAKAGPLAASATRYRRWCKRQWLLFALPSLAGLAVLGRLPALLTMPGELAPGAALLPRLSRADLVPVLCGAAAGAALGGFASLALAWWRRRRGRPAGPLLIGKIGALLPRHRGELGWAALLAISAGISEELPFRLLLPLLLAMVTGSATVAWIGATLIFGAVHLYQGWLGVVATAVVGALLAGVYLISGALWAAMLVHIAVDLNGLVLRPVLSGVWRRAGEPRW